ncbi:MAG: hypothetical protein DVB31_11835, partial [Verrucomicrobia bacterium]
MTPPEAVRGLAASNFILRHHFYLRVERDLDLDPATPEIELNLGVGSDDGFLLEVAGSTLGTAADRGFSYTWMPVRFGGEGLYEVTLLYAANAVGQSGLEFSWITAARGTEIVPQSHLYTSPDVGDRLITFEELPAGTVVADQFRPIGIRFSTTEGIRVASDRPDRFVPVSPANVLGDSRTSGAPDGVVELQFVVPGTDAPA